MPEVTVTVAATADLDDLVASVAGLFNEDAGQHDSTMDTSWPERDGAAYYTDLIADPNSLVALARDGTGTVGHLIGKLVEPDSIRLVRLAVLESIRVAPHTRGHGVGALLVQNFFDWARAKGADRASVSAYAANHGALRFYAKHGFTPQSITLRAPL
jgi:GNAT superfamily N-acetyltransferase